MSAADSGYLAGSAPIDLRGRRICLTLDHYTTGERCFVAYDLGFPEAIGLGLDVAEAVQALHDSRGALEALDASSGPTPSSSGSDGSGRTGPAEAMVTLDRAAGTMTIHNPSTPELPELAGPGENQENAQQTANTAPGTDRRV